MTAAALTSRFRLDHGRSVAQFNSQPAHDRAVELRRDVRHPANVRAILNFGSYWQQTTIKNISLGGMKVEGAHGLFPGSKVSVSLLNGLERRGVVRWWLNGACGIQFESRLSTQDEFYQAAIAKSARTRLSALSQR